MKKARRIITTNELPEEKSKKKEDPSDAFFIDRWCARHVRKVSFCAECLHYQECLVAEEPGSPSAIEHRKAKKGETVTNYEYWKQNLK